MLDNDLRTVVNQESSDSKKDYKVSVAVSFFFKFYHEVLSETFFKEVFTIGSMSSLKMNLKDLVNMTLQGRS